MIRACRLCRSKYARTALDGEGARRAGGRWGPPGVPIAYCSSTLSLCALECLVHFDVSEAPSDYVAVALEIPEPSVEVLPTTELPRDWRDTPPPRALRALGREWADSLRSAVLRVPSAIVPDEANYLVNPRHPDVSRIRVAAPVPFRFDPGLFVGNP